jgi:hypothetical protein
MIKVQVKTHTKKAYVMKIYFTDIYAFYKA